MTPADALPSAQAPVEVVTLGETMALLGAPEIGLLRHANTMRLSVGGAESNLAIGLARLGRKVTWIGRVGDDEFGRLVQMTLAGQGVDVSAAVVDPAAPTALLVKERRTSRLTRVYYWPNGWPPPRARAPTR